MSEDCPNCDGSGYDGPGFEPCPNHNTHGQGQVQPDDRHSRHSGCCLVFLLILGAIVLLM